MITYDPEGGDLGRAAIKPITALENITNKSGKHLFIEPEFDGSHLVRLTIYSENNL